METERRVLKAPPPADYHPLLTSGIFSALLRAARANVKTLILRIPLINYISIFVTESARLVFLRRSSHSLPVTQRVWALMCHVFVTDCFLFKFSYFILFFSVSVFFYSLVLSSTGAREGKKFLQPHIFLKSPGRSHPARPHHCSIIKLNNCYSILFLRTCLTYRYTSVKKIAPWLVLRLYFTGKTIQT